MAELFLLTGEIRSGKTTALLNWSGRRNDVFGILTPVIDDKRVFMDVSIKEVFEMEACEGEDFMEIGKYKFKKTSFDKAIHILLSAKQKEGWLIVDEIGPLELKDQGFSEVVKAIIHLNENQKVIFVVRNSILQRVIDHFQLQKLNYKVITINSHLFRS